MSKYELDMPKQNKFGWYVAVENSSFYLRKDLQVLDFIGWDTDNSGYFETFEEANEARNKYLSIVSDKKLNNYQTIISKNYKKIEYQKNEIKMLQDKLNIANGTVAKQIDEISSLNRILSSKQQYLEKALSDFEKHYESQLKVQDNELKRRLTIIHYLEDKLFNKGE